MQPLFFFPKQAFYPTACQAPYKHILLFHKVYTPSFWNMKWQALSGISAELHGSYCSQPPETANWLWEASSQDLFSWYKNALQTWNTEIVSLWSSKEESLYMCLKIPQWSARYKYASLLGCCCCQHWKKFLSVIKKPLHLTTNGKYTPLHVLGSFISFR